MKKIKDFWNKGKWQKAVVIVIILMLSALIGIIFPSQESDALLDYNINNSENLTLSLNTHNDSSAVDEITKLAEENLRSNSKEESQKIINNGLGYIKTNIDNITSNNEIMEKSMYYGCYIYKYIELNSGVNDVSKLKEKDNAAYYIGYYTYTYVKYPYRNINDTSENKINKVKEYFDTLQ